MRTHHKCLTFMSMIYLTIKLMTILLIYKIVTIGPFTITASTIIIPIWFLIGDIIAEEYGYEISKQLIWITLLCQFIFAFSCALLIKLGSPPSWSHQAAYEQILGSLPRVAIASFIAIFFGALLNASLLTKWKILLNGKYFWLRSLAASAIGEAIFTIAAYLIEFLGVVPFATLIELMTISFITKIIVGLIFVFPSSLIAALLQKIEGIGQNNNAENFKIEGNKFFVMDLKGKIN